MHVKKKIHEVDTKQKVVLGCKQIFKSSKRIQLAGKGFIIHCYTL